MVALNRRENDMTLTLKKDINMNSLVVQHEILLQATSLLMGREGVLETEKELYLILSVVNAMIEEDLIQMCNEDGRDLVVIMAQDIEPFFKATLDRELPKDVYDKMKKMLLDRCKEIWDNQHSIVGVIDTILTTIAMMSPEDKKEALVETAKIAEQAFEKRSATMEKKADETNSKLEELVKQYQKQSAAKKNDTTK